METSLIESMLPSELIGFLILELLLLFSKFYKLCTGFFPVLPRRTPKSKLGEEAGTEEETALIRREDVEVVMERLGLMGGFAEGEKLEELMGPAEIAAIFEEEKLSLEEFREAFAVFDENGDGFVEAADLQRVLCRLGFEEGVGLDSCAEMIGASDENGDGRIDFDEFVTFMESSFS